MRQETVHRNPTRAEAAAIGDATSMGLHRINETSAIEGALVYQFFEHYGDDGGSLFGRLDGPNVQFSKCLGSIGQKVSKT
ncbi:hypothetical protein HCU64_09400 [Methylobacterium sp. C25]|uniref:hypothetical protein n=1 Tax=Methylobacterium sp. C25 TaxID=2721622 RepID=UPI001F2E9107|nr:hypothetical protein [Methylobacterium sp. C25]MCE4223965.1 hypothetical protein [Methylobacterium sp. C25]